MNIKFENKWLKDFFEIRPSFSIRKLEREADLPAKTLDHFINGRRDLSEANLKKILPILKKYGHN